MEPNEMRKHRLPLDDTTADRLAGGELAPADSPPGYHRVAEVLTGARSGFAATEVDPALLREMVRAVESSPEPLRNPSIMSKLRTTKVATIAAAVVISTTGAAAAATGNLPGPAQDAVSDAVSHVGLDLPASGDDHPTGNVDNPTTNDEHGVDVSDVARTTDATGRDKGAAVSETARAGHGPDADDDGTTSTTEVEDESTEPGKPADPGSQAPVSTPNHGDARSDNGGSHAADPDAQGSGNAEDHPSADDNPGTSHRPNP
jgi:hypothetical protein